MQFEFKLCGKSDSHVKRHIVFLERIHDTNTELSFYVCLSIYELERNWLDYAQWVFSAASINLHPHFSLAVNFLPVWNNGLDYG